MKGPGGYGRYDDDPKHVGCPRAKSDMTPCIARDGAICLAPSQDDPEANCVGCGAEPHALLRELLGEPPYQAEDYPAAKGPAADRLQALVREATEPIGRGQPGLTSSEGGRVDDNSAQPSPPASTTFGSISVPVTRREIERRYFTDAGFHCRVDLAVRDLEGVTNTTFDESDRSLATLATAHAFILAERL